MSTVPAVVGAEIVVGPLDAGTISRLRKRLRYPNPAFVKACMGTDVPDMPNHLHACDELEDGRVRLPRGAISELHEVLHRRRLKALWRDERSYGSSLELQLHGVEPRDYQRAGAELVRRRLQGLIVLPCGGGKTYLGLTAITAVGRTTLVVVPTRILVHQWFADCEKLLGFRPAIFGAGKSEIGPLTIATADALVHRKRQDLSSFGLVIYDEAHSVPAPTRLELMKRLPARYRLGLTATPEREDGTSKLVRWSFGDVLLEKTVQQLVRSGHLKLPTVQAIDTSFAYPFPEEASWKDFNRLTKAIVQSKPRNQLICDLVCREPEATWLVLSPSSKSHAEKLAAMISARGLRADHVTSNRKKSDQRRIMDDFRQGTLRVLVATSLADQGLDVRHLSRVVLALPEGSKGRTTQRIGRSMRPYGEPPVVYDLVDRNVDVLLSRWRKRKSIYRSFNMEIEECPTLSLFRPETV